NSAVGLTAAAIALNPQNAVAQSSAAGAKAMVDVRSFGATGDGTTIDTPAINKAIDSIAASGGGTLFFPAGNYLSYSIHLKSNIALYLDAGATIVAADSPANGAAPAPGASYDAAEPNDGDNHYQDFGHSHWHNSLIWAEGMENISITGPGRIWGKGLSRGAGREGPRAESPGVGNKSIALKNCRNVVLRDFSILHGGHFGILATGADNLTLDNLKIDTNRDGMDIDCCRNVRISNCYVNSPWDDGICLKSSYGLGSAKPTEFVTITNCYVSGCFEEGTLLDATYKRFDPAARIPHTGRIKFGTESNGGFRNITISNCVFEGCQGLALETVDGALLEDVTITNISMRDIISAPIFLRLGRRMRGPKDAAIGMLRRIIISNIVCSNSVTRLGSIISGIPGHEIEDVKISNVTVQHQGGGTKEDAALQPAEREETYPEPGMFGTMPSHGFYVRHVKGIQFDNIDIQPAKEDQRPTFVLDQVDDADFFRIRTPKVEGVPLFSLTKVSDFSVHFCTGVPDTHIDHTVHQTVG
ncbi:MAG TPA: glycoside hydrolase family 28 protein, partial [Bryobacteraceae bacterium]|nr:glycoside hydrolase family 28 protein [Bryobacteraceae bacterium]